VLLCSARLDGLCDPRRLQRGGREIAQVRRRLRVQPQDALPSARGAASVLTRALLAGCAWTSTRQSRSGTAPCAALESAASVRPARSLGRRRARCDTWPAPQAFEANRVAKKWAVGPEAQRYIDRCACKSLRPKPAPKAGAGAALTSGFAAQDAPRLPAQRARPPGRAARHGTPLPRYSRCGLHAVAARTGRERPGPAPFCCRDRRPRGPAQHFALFVVKRASTAFCSFCR